MSVKQQILDLLAQARSLSEDITVDGLGKDLDTEQVFAEIFEALDTAAERVEYYAD
jgi:hypothetical protein